MKLARRNFLGLIGGAAAAGPKLAQGIATNVASSPMALASGSGATLNAASGSFDEKKWRIDRIAKLRNILAGQDDEAAQRRKMNMLYLAENIERFRLDGIRSVSPQHKMRMLIDGNIERQERINRIHAERELDDLLKFNI